MQRFGTAHRYSASDIVNFSGCSHLTHLDLVNLETPLLKAEDTEEMALIAGKGFAHEAQYWEHLQKSHSTAANLAQDDATDEERFATTKNALRRGDDVLFQGTLLGGPWVGHADFFLKVATPSLLGNFSYEVADTKLARSSRAKFLVQLCLYSEMLAEVQGVMPKHMHVVLGDGRRETFVVDDYLRYFRRLKGRFLKWVDEARQATYPEHCDRCGNCRWRDLCAGQWTADDHLNQVAGIARSQIAKLRGAGIYTLQALSLVGPTSRVPKVQSDTLQRLAHQARLQVQSRTSGRPVYEVLPLAPGRGFNRLPPPDADDLYFDMEGNPLEEGGLEYLFGLYYFSGGAPVFKTFWAHTRAEEKVAFEQFIDFVWSHLTRHPDAHVYHYAPYEPTALKRLMSSHGTRETEVDNLLRYRKLVDLYAVVREAVRVGEDSYSIKSIERFYSSKARDGDVKTAGASVVFYEKWKSTQDPALLKSIEDYNLDDVRSTFELREWLLSIREPGASWAGAWLAGTAAATAAPSEKAMQAAASMEEYRRRLVAGLPEHRLEWTNEHRAQELMFHLLGFHRRADKPAWWALFARQQASEEELLDDLEAIAGLKQVAPPKFGAKGMRYAYRFPEQDTKLKTGDSCSVVATLEEISDLEVNEETGEVSFTLDSAEQLPAVGVAIGAGLPISTAFIQGAVRRFVDDYLDGGGKFKAGMSFLLRDVPDVNGVCRGESLLQAGESLVAGTSRVVANLKDSYLFIQGPPGAGKTYTGSHVIADLLRAGRRIAVTSNSHKAINNLLHAVERVATERGLSFKGAKKSTSEESRVNGTFISDILNAQEIYKTATSFQLVAGTAWLFSSPKLEYKFDYLFVDEAGQVSLANLIAMSTCARNIVLLGDQMQLGQPIQGVHPGESGQSTLEYLLEGAATIAPEHGVFLKDTWRMHPDVCRFISEAVYEGRLEAEESNENQRLVLPSGATSVLRETGLSFIEVNHDGCSQRSDDEAEVIRVIVDDLLKGTFLDRRGVEHPMRLENILVVAPYNMQVNRLKQVLPEGARVGTVDKFQGQEAEAVLVSMTTSSGEYLPRDIDFLYSKNRLNVAISRARCWVGVVASPRLLDVSVKSPVQMGLVNTLCWAQEYSNQ